MRIMQINSVCGYGSTGKIATDLYEILEENGHECLIAYGRGNAPKGIKSIKIGSTFDEYVHVAKTRLLDKHGFASTNATKEFIKKAKEYDPDVIHLHNIHGYYINIELLFNYLKEANKPVVWTLHDCWAFTGHCAYFDRVGCDKWKTGCYDCPQKNEYPKSILVDNSKYNFKRKKELFSDIKNLTIVTPSKWLANLVEESYLQEYNIKIINNGIDLNLFSPKDKSIFRKKYTLEDKFLILGVASVWDERKGLEHFLELSKLIDNDSRVILVGIDDKQLKSLPKNIIGIKRTNSIEELAEIYSAADIFVNPTLEDNFPTTNLEALACGTPVISFNTGGSIESIDNSCGIIVKENSTDSLLESIKNCKNNKFSINSCSQRAQLYEKHDKFNMYLRIYNEVLR